MPFGVLSTYPVDLKDFRDWLVQKDPDDQVGMSAHPGCCPIRNYLWQDDHGVDTVQTTHVSVYCGAVKLDFRLPKEVEYFITALDHSVEDIGVVSFTAQEVLWALDTMYPELAQQ